MRMPARSHDLLSPPTNRAPFIVYADEREEASTRVDLISTDRIGLSLLRLEPGSEVGVEGRGQDVVVQVLSGASSIAGSIEETGAERGTSILLVEPETLRIRAVTAVSCLVAESRDQQQTQQSRG